MHINGRPPETISINTLAKHCNLSRATLLRMEEAGLLTPAYKDPESGYRYYDISNLDRVISIINYQNIGLSKKEIADIFNNADCVEDYLNRLKEQHLLIVREIDKLSTINSKDSTFHIRQIDYYGKNYLRYTEEVSNEPVEIQLFIKRAINHFLSTDLTGIVQNFMHVYSIGGPSRPFDSSKREFNALLPVVESSHPTEEIVYIESSPALALVGHCYLKDADEYYKKLIAEIQRFDVKPIGNPRYTCFPEVVTYDLGPDTLIPFSFLQFIE